jgi:hypothetical protein
VRSRCCSANGRLAIFSIRAFRSHTLHRRRQLVFGRNLFAEAMLTSLAFGLAAALTVMAARWISGSLLIGVIAALVEVAMFPRGYSYPKMLLYAAAPLVIWWYVKRPSWGRMSALALFAQVAFLFRHDHGLFIGIGAAVAVALAGDGIRSTRVILRQLASLPPWRSLRPCRTWSTSPSMAA